MSYSCTVASGIVIATSRKERQIYLPVVEDRRAVGRAVVFLVVGFKETTVDVGGTCELGDRGSEVVPYKINDQLKSVPSIQIINANSWKHVRSTFFECLCHWSNCLLD